jgi:hypothetical protein
LAVNIVKPDASRPITIQDSTMQEVFREWSRQITDEVNGRSLIFGTGSPEGVIEASKGREYMDNTGTASAIKYIKKVNDVAGDKSQGWILI